MPAACVGDSVSSLCSLFGFGPPQNFLLSISKLMNKFIFTNLEYEATRSHPDTAVYSRRPLIRIRMSVL